MSVNDSPLIPVTTYQYALLFQQAGLSVIPVPRGQKGGSDGPLRQMAWARYQQERADPLTIKQWFDVPEPPNLAIVLGQVSGGLQALDADHPGFSVFLEESILPATHDQWWGRTGSGKMHFLVRSEGDTRTTNLYLRGTNIKLADIRGDGAYVLAPPSLHPSGGIYQILTSILPRIARVPDALQLFNQMQERYAEQMGSNVDYLLRPTKEIRRAEEGEDYRTLMDDLRDAPLSGRVRTAILNGAHHGQGDWSQSPSDSEIDYAVIAALLEIDWDPDRIERVFATLPLGKNCYRNTNRDNYGTQYLANAFKNWERGRALSATARQAAKGVDWEVMSVRRIEQTSPRYEAAIRCPDGIERTAVLTTEDIVTEKRMSLRLAELFSTLPKFQPVHRGRGYRDFATAILEMAERTSVPRAATGAGYLQSLLAEILLRDGRIKDGIPTLRAEASMGWRDDEDVYVRGMALMAQVHLRMTRNVPPEDVWGALRALGAREERVAVPWGAERLWRVPMERLNND